MFNQLYEKVKNYLKENKKPIIIFLLLYFLFTWPLPYSIYTSGGIIDIDKKISLEHEYQKKGTFNFAYVNELKGTIPTILLSHIISDWNLIRQNNRNATGESIEDINYRDHLFLDESIQNATILVYNKLKKDVDITDTHHYVVYVDKDAITNLNITDEILEVNGKKLNNVNDYISIVNNSNYGDLLAIKIKTQDHIIKNKTIKVLNINNTKITGIYIITKYTYTTNPPIAYHFSSNESGPSGGLMLALTIYNKLSPNDITKGKKIVGTGTINIDGSVGEISGIEYKLKGAVHEKADLFIAPNGDNYNDAVKLKNKKHYKIKIIGVSTFDDALNYLNMM